MLIIRCILPFWPQKSLQSLTHSAPGRSDPFSSMGWVVAGWRAPFVLDPELCCCVPVYHVVPLVVDTEKIYGLLNGLVRVLKWGLKQVLNDKGMSQTQIGMRLLYVQKANFDKEKVLRVWVTGPPWEQEDDQRRNYTVLPLCLRPVVAVTNATVLVPAQRRLIFPGLICWIVFWRHHLKKIARLLVIEFTIRSHAWAWLLS